MSETNLPHAALTGSNPALLARVFGADPHPPVKRPLPSDEVPSGYYYVSVHALDELLHEARREGIRAAKMHMEVRP